MKMLRSFDIMHSSYYVKLASILPSCSRARSSYIASWSAMDDVFWWDFHSFLRGPGVFEAWLSLIIYRIGYLQKSLDVLPSITTHTIDDEGMYSSIGIEIPVIGDSRHREKMPIYNKIPMKAPISEAVLFVQFLTCPVTSLLSKLALMLVLSAIRGEEQLK
jgi:hypothetical protein